jgi:hypothetical protein
VAQYSRLQNLEITLLAILFRGYDYFVPLSGLK